MVNSHSPGLSRENNSTWIGGANRAIRALGKQRYCLKIFQERAPETKMKGKCVWANNIDPSVWTRSLVSHLTCIAEFASKRERYTVVIFYCRGKPRTDEGPCGVCYKARVKGQNAWQWTRVIMVCMDNRIVFEQPILDRREWEGVVIKMQNYISPYAFPHSLHPWRGAKLVYISVPAPPRPSQSCFLRRTGNQGTLWAFAACSFLIT